MCPFQNKYYPSLFHCQKLMRVVKAVGGDLLPEYLPRPLLSTQENKHQREAWRGCVGEQDAKDPTRQEVGR